MADLVDFDVTSWTKQEVTAKTAALCVTPILAVNLARKEAFKITGNGGLFPDGCKEMKHWQLSWTTPRRRQEHRGAWRGAL